MTNKYLVLVTNLVDIKDYQKAGITAFLFALKDFSVGYANTYDYNDIEALPGDKYLLINQLLNCAEVEAIEAFLQKPLAIKGIIYEDIAIYQIVKKNNLPYELIYYPNHLLCNQEAVSYWLKKGVDSVVLASELTYNEVRTIVDRFPNKLTLSAFGYQQIMYSRRLLLSNYAIKYNLAKLPVAIIKEPQTGLEFLVIENNKGTVIYNNAVFDGTRLLEKSDVYYYLIDSVFLKAADLISFINGEKLLIDNLDQGFLDQETIYRLKERINNE